MIPRTNVLGHWGINALVRERPGHVHSGATWATRDVAVELCSVDLGLSAMPARSDIATDEQPLGDQPRPVHATPANLRAAGVFVFLVVCLHVRGESKPGCAALHLVSGAVVTRFGFLDRSAHTGVAHGDVRWSLTPHAPPRTMGHTSR